MEKELLEKFAHLIDNTLLQALGIEFLLISDGHIEAKMPVDSRTVQPYGVLHGGASAALAETLGSFGSHFLVEKDESHAFGIELNINHVKSVTSGWVKGIALIKHKGKTLHVWNIDIVDEDGQLVATSRLTVIIKPSRNA
ncbi:MAG: hotdog fold thioesterase [Flavobacteriales bacterium]|nr:hotdog fold thioesterase [Flavobacteriales bacterium]